MTNENDYLTATGKIDYNMTNDYMFRVILQENKIVLKGLVCSLLHYDKDFIKSVEVKNPIILGENIDEKTYVLDVNILLNDDTILNLEMQMQDLTNWTDRALNYTCRNFTHLQKGHDYTETQSVIHIFSSKIRIGVVDLNRTELATEEDKTYGIDQWVALFKSKTWEELRMIANEKPELLEATKSLYEYNNETTIRYQCYAREDYRKMMNTIRRNEKEQTEKLEEQSRILEENAEKIQEQAETIQEQAGTIQEQAGTIDELTSYIKELEEKLAKQNK